MAKRLDSVTSGTNLLEDDDVSMGSCSSDYTSVGYRDVRKVLNRGSMIFQRTIYTERSFGCGIRVSLIVSCVLAVLAGCASGYVIWVELATEKPVCIKCDGGTGRLKYASTRNINGIDFCCGRLQDFLQNIMGEHNYSSTSLPNTMGNSVKINAPLQVANMYIDEERHTSDSDIPWIEKHKVLPVWTLNSKDNIKTHGKVIIGKTFVELIETGKYLISSQFNFTVTPDSQKGWDTYGHTVNRYNPDLPNDNVERLLGGFYTICKNCDATEFDKSQNSYISGIFTLKAGDKVYVSVNSGSFTSSNNYLSIISLENRRNSTTS